MLSEGTARHHHAAGLILILEEVVGELTQMFLLDLLKTELAAIFHYLLVLADHPTDTHNHSILA